MFSKYKQFIRQDDDDLSRRVLLSKPGGRHPRGRPKLRWEDGVVEDVARLGCRNWKVVTLNREREKYKQCCFIKIQVAHTWIAKKCHKGLQETCGEQILWDSIVARWVRVFWGERAGSVCKLWLRQLLKAAVEVHNACVRTLPDTNWQWTCIKLSSEISTATDNPKILTKNLKMQKICAQRVPPNLIRGTRAAIHGNHQTAPEGESLPHWILIACDMGPFTWTWAEKTVNWMTSPSNNMPAKISTGTGSAISNVQCGLQLWGYSPRTICLSWQYSKHYLLQKPTGKSPKCVTSDHISYGQDQLCHMVKLTVTLPAQWLNCLKGGTDKFWYMRRTDWKWAHMTTTTFRQCTESASGQEAISWVRSVHDNTSTIGATVGVKCLSQVWQHVYNVTGNYI
jgi:hypothetical protein